ncbi:histone deacetylase family protein [Pelotomaculum propionicicum]|uniref:Histone deacetylase-like amidohydrolase n=1 Tax=Pelotomaculum propionicicum TaxID=258475 RepID=A0A4Y7RKY5_9FIRM|nr:histone deacetylase family protein [Pelotomaculum propionicicum]NLI13160.1 histone deacetylase family protein [Peptococcaceae bacterium]TEB09399.1 Histone deacetylase-like amidohydrolase [Pelotomaculum propionicicum]
MKIVFHELFRQVYDYDPAAAAGRMDCIVEEVKDLYEFVEPEAAAQDDLLLVHSRSQLDWVKNKGPLYNVAVFSAGAAIKAAAMAVQGTPAFALNRPPGHHASRNSSWGFCWFNNIAVAVEKLRTEGLVKKVLIVDTDLHFGDGTDNIFADNPEVFYYHVYNLDGLEQFLSMHSDYDLIAVSAGFDKHKLDWGLIFSTEDFNEIGRIVSSHARKVCGGRFFAVLEGGYNHKVLGKNVKAMLEGFDSNAS